MTRAVAPDHREKHSKEENREDEERDLLCGVCCSDGISFYIKAWNPVKTCEAITQALSIALLKLMM